MHTNDTVEKMRFVFYRVKMSYFKNVIIHFCLFNFICIFIISIVTVIVMASCSFSSFYPSTHEKNAFAAKYVLIYTLISSHISNSFCQSRQCIHFNRYISKKLCPIAETLWDGVSENGKSTI